jgi:outer membrane receptor for ferrienterochelin and colicins
MRAWLAFSLALAVGRVASAQEREPIDAPEIVVEGERTSEPTQERVFEDRPVETEVVKDEEIKQLPVTNAVDLARHLAGIRTQARVQGEEAVVSIEGLPPEYTRILVNGQRYSGGVGGVDDLRDFPIHALDRVEVKRGTQGVRQGGEGAGGVIEFVTRKPPKEGVHGSVESGLGADGKILAATATEFMAGPVGITLSALHDQIRGFDPHGDAFFSVAGGQHSRRVGRDLYGTATWSPSRSVELHSRLGWRREDESFVELDSDYPFENQAMAERRDYTRWVATNGFEWSATEATRFRGDLTWYGDTTDSEVGREFTEDEDEWKLDLQSEHLFETGWLAHALTAGLDLRRPSLQLENGPLPVGVPADLVSDDVDTDFQSGAFFLEDEIALHERVSLLAGVRTELHSEFGFDVLPQVALLLRPLETVRVRLSWGRNRRVPTLEDLFQPPVPQLGGAYFLQGNPDLGTESSTSWRAGVEWEPREWAAASVTGFWNDIDDAIRSIRDRDLNVVTGYREEQLRPCPPRCGTILVPIVTPAPLFRKENLDQLRTRGIEADLRLRPHPRVEVRLAYTYLQTKVIDSNIDIDELPNSPHHVVDATIAARIPRLETSVALTGRWRGPALTEASGTGLLSFASGEESHTSLLLDLRVTQPIRKGFDVYVDFQNMLNEASVDSYAIRGFTFFVGVRADLGWSKGRIVQ